MIALEYNGLQNTNIPFEESRKHFSGRQKTSNNVLVYYYGLFFFFSFSGIVVDYLVHTELMMII